MGRAVAGCFLLVLSACADIPPIPPASPMPQSAILVNVTRWTSLPAGYDRGVAALTPQRWRELVTVNREVNREITYTADPDPSGMHGTWMLPIYNRGNCVSIALEKMRRLVDLAWPRNALRIGVVWPPGVKETHAVLTVETHLGTFVLDQLKGANPIVWSAGDYFWIAREHPQKGEVKWEYFPSQPTAMLPLPSCG